MLFTLISYTEKFGERHLVQQRIKLWSKNVFSCKNDIHQSLMVVDGAPKLDYASVIFVAVQIY